MALDSERAYCSDFIIEMPGSDVDACTFSLAECIFCVCYEICTHVREEVW